MKKAFSLIELLIVISIIAILSTLIIYAVGAAQAKSRDAKRKSDIKAISVALESYKAQMGKYPQPCGLDADLAGRLRSKIDSDHFGCTSADDQVAAGKVNALLTKGYIATVPLDPRENSTTGYFYSASTDGKDYKLTANNIEYLTGSDPVTCKSVAGEYYDPIRPCGDYQVSSNADATKDW